MVYGLVVSSLLGSLLEMCNFSFYFRFVNGSVILIVFLGDLDVR